MRPAINLSVPSIFSTLVMGLACLLVPAASLLAQTATIRDEAGMFSKSALSQSEARLSELKSKSSLPVTIQTRTSAEGKDPAKYAIQLASTYAGKGLYVLILKNDRKIEVLWSGDFSKTITNDDKDKIRNAITTEFKANKYDEGLSKGLDAITTVCMRFPVGKVAAAPAPPVPASRPAPMAPMPATPAPAQQSPGLGSGIFLILLLGVGLLILIGVIRSISGARSYNAGMGPGRIPGPGPGAAQFGPGGGYGPGYGGGGGGGFFSGMLGGLGGAILGNWAYDRLGGGHSHHQHDAGSMTGLGAGGWGGSQANPPTEQNNQWFGADDGGDWSSSSSSSSDWGSASGGDSGGWSGSDSGGDWGGGSDSSGSTDW
jgi:uncharacterized protein